MVSLEAQVFLPRISLGRTVIAARMKWDKYKFMRRGPNQQIVPCFVIEAQGRWLPVSSLSGCSGTTANRVSRIFWCNRVSLTNIVHRFHSMKRQVFGPLAPQDLYHSEPYYGQHLDPLVDTLP